MDYFIYSGSIERGNDLDFINMVYENVSSDTCTVIMTSGGGNPDAAYKMARYLQSKYDAYNVLVSGVCKSAATLFVIGAKEIVFCPFGELGPLDIQLQKDDKLTQHESGLNINEAFSTLEKHSKETFYSLVFETIKQSSGVVTFKTASEVATKMVEALYGPIFSQIEPEEVGSRIRAMRIGEEYANRLDRHGNMKPGALHSLVEGYSSHSFVIDSIEAETLFKNVRLVNEEEAKIISDLDDSCRFPTNNLIIEKIEVKNDSTTKKKRGASKAYTNGSTKKPKSKSSVSSKAH